MRSNKYINEIPLHLMIVPSLALILLFQYVPMAGLAMAFQKFHPVKGIFGSDWIGLDNFRYIWSMPDFPLVIRNTVYIAVMKIVAGLIAPIIVALLLNEMRIVFIKRSVQTLIYLPHFLSWVILGGVLIDVLSPSEGIVNRILNAFGFESIFFLADNRAFPFVLVVSEVWKEFGFGTILYLAALTSINPSLYEAAVVDGANRWKQTVYVTLPGIMPMIALLATLSLGNVLNAGFDQVFNLYNARVYESGDILDTYIYRLLMEQAQFSVATAVGLFKSVISFVLIGISYYLAYRYADYRIF